MEHISTVIDRVKSSLGKTCSKCNAWKPFNRFYHNSASNDGYRPDCKDCEHIPARHKTAEERFWAKVKKGDLDNCWEWQGGTATNNGYGRLWTHEGHITAHCFSWQLHNGDIPPGMQVCHTCDNPKCVNPNHLFLGSSSVNAQDMILKLRGTQKLSPDDVRIIRAMLKDERPRQEIADRFNVSRGSINNIARGATWRWLDA